MDLAKEITEFCKNVIARPCKRDELIREITHMASHNTAWPTASYKQWEAAIETACKRGLLILVVETVWVPVEVAEVKARQQELF